MCVRCRRLLSSYPPSRISAPDRDEVLQVLRAGQAGVDGYQRKEAKRSLRLCCGVELVVPVEQEVAQGLVFVVVGAVVIGGGLTDVERGDSDSRRR
jgi:hypothetical protein